VIFNKEPKVPSNDFYFIREYLDIHPSVLGNAHLKFMGMSRDGGANYALSFITSRGEFGILLPEIEDLCTKARATVCKWNHRANSAEPLLSMFVLHLILRPA
jgi:hypothetical protein